MAALITPTYGSVVTRSTLNAPGGANSHRRGHPKGGEYMDLLAILAALLEPAEDADTGALRSELETGISGLQASHDERGAQIDSMTADHAAAIEALQAELQACKAHNYELLCAIGAEVGTDAGDAAAAGGDDFADEQIDVDDLFTEPKEGGDE